MRNTTGGTDSEAIKATRPADREQHGTKGMAKRRKLAQHQAWRYRVAGHEPTEEGKPEGRRTVAAVVEEEHGDVDVDPECTLRRPPAIFKRRGNCR